MGKLIRHRIELDPREFSFGNDHRTPGIHLTDIVRDMLAQAGISKQYKTEAEGGFSEAQLGAFALQGFLWEEVFSREIARIVLRRNSEYIRLGEIACPMTSADGAAFLVQYDRAGNLETPIPARHILLTIDALRAELVGRISLAEFKWALKSARMDPEIEKPEWFWQARGYLYGVGELLGHPIERVEWNVQFPRGEYRGGEPPIYELWERDYSPGEVRDCWESLAGHVNARVEADPSHRWGEYV